MEFSNKLIRWYLANKRDFPWRNTKEPYKIWLSEVILQQTRTIQGLPYYIAFIKKYKSIQQLANADEQEILKLWQGLGYYSRARNLHFTAKYIDNELNGVFPDNYKDLLYLKGVGDYTASAIASICYDEKCAVVDGNVYRVLSRYFGIETPINSSKGIKEFKVLAQKLLPKENYGLYNQAIMDFGAIICIPKKPKCNDCMFNDSCFALQQKRVVNLPVKISKTKIKNRYFNYLVILSSGNKISIQKRRAKGIWQHLYEFPVIETSTNLNFEEIIKLKELKLFNAKSIYLFNSKPIVHKLSHQHIFANFWIIKTQKTLLKAININELNEYPVPTLIDNFIKDFKL